MQVQSSTSNFNVQLNLINTVTNIYYSSSVSFNRSDVHLTSTGRVVRTPEKFQAMDCRGYTKSSKRSTKDKSGFSRQQVQHRDDL